MKKILLLISILFVSFGYSQISTENYEDYKNMISGRFSSYPQTLVDTTKSDVLIRTKYLFEKDGYSLFYTQQGEWYKEIFYPYRQRIYKTKNEGSHIILEIHTIDVPYDVMSEGETSFVVDEKKIIQSLENGGMVKKQGCDIELIQVYSQNGKPILYGSTNEKDCVATFNGSTYTEVQFLIFPKYLISWERGYDNNGKQVWGPEESPYIFFKIK